MNCLHCNKETNNPKFCSKSCAATYNNMHREKKAYHCKKCGVEIGKGYQNKDRQYCKDCLLTDWSSITYGDFLSQHDRASDAHARIRDIARRVYRRSDKPKACMNCGYDKHYEVCHIQAIESFEPTASIADINNISNLVGLCPNCHWELDHYLLQCKEEWR